MRAGTPYLKTQWIAARRIFSVPTISRLFAPPPPKSRTELGPYMKQNGIALAKSGCFAFAVMVFCNIWCARSAEPYCRSAVGALAWISCRKSLLRRTGAWQGRRFRRMGYIS